ncbi:hypothetical protein BH10ACT9_BH10ACT9_36520 [soil metagenome]
MSMLTAIDLDNLLTNIDTEIAEAIREALPVDFRDQLSAAARSSREITESAAGTEGQEVGAANVAAWLRLGALDALVGWLTNACSTCLHSPNPARPQPIWSAAWKPNLVVCTPCLRLLKVSGVADRLCDCCGTDTLGEGIATVTVVLGAMVYQAGACTECQDEAIKQAAA